MKTTFNYVILSLLALSSMALTSCETDDNEEIAYTLDGTWEGDMHISAAWSRIPYAYRSSRISFSKDPYRYANGTGYWVDFYDSYGRSYAADRFDWEVRDRVIYIHFWYHPADLEIYDYYISDGYFYGWVDDGYQESRFRMYKTDWNSWNEYYYDDYWWSNSVAFDTDEANKSAVPFKE